MRRIRRGRPVLPSPSAFTGFRFAREVISLAVRWYLGYGVSYRDVEEPMVEADHGHLKSRLRMMRGLKRLRSTRVFSAGTPSCRTSDVATKGRPPLRNSALRR